MAGKGGGGKDKGEGKPWQWQAPEEGKGKDKGKGKDSHGKDKGKGKPWQWQRQAPEEGKGGCDESRSQDACEVAFFDHAKGYGIITSEGFEWPTRCPGSGQLFGGLCGQNELFVLRDDVIRGALVDGDAVLYDEAMDDESGFLKSENVTGGSGANSKSVMQVVAWQQRPDRPDFIGTDDLIHC
jgi:hypothetical protein